MSITRIHAIKATVKKSIEYITDPDKTDDKNLVYTFGTSLENAASTFRLEHENHSGRDTNLAYHLIQSFAPGEVAPDEAHDIGKERDRPCMDRRWQTHRLSHGWSAMEHEPRWHRPPSAHT